MARRRKSKKSSDPGLLGLLCLGFIVLVVKAALRLVTEVAAAIAKLINDQKKKESFGERKINKQRSELLNEILHELHLENSGLVLNEYDDRVVVKSFQTFDKYSDYKYLKDTNSIEKISTAMEERKWIADAFYYFLEENDYKKRPQYGYVEKQLIDYASRAKSYRVKVEYITSAGNKKEEKVLDITDSRISELKEQPEFFMTKGQYNAFLRRQAKKEVEAMKQSFYARVNDIIDYVNSSKDIMVVKSATKTLDDLVQELLKETTENIEKIRTKDSEKWWSIDNAIIAKERKIKEIVQEDKKIRDYYESEQFTLIKDTCHLLIESQKEFNEYIEEKAGSIEKLFGKRVVRSETQNKYVYNYIRPYKKNITPFNAEVSASVLGSAERDPIEYVIKYFYPNKSQYKNQIQNLRILIEELESLNEAKTIIDNYKKDYEEYIQTVPEYVMKNDEDGFYSRLGLAIIDDAILNVEYKFTYTSDAGIVQRVFPVPMNEEYISELIYRLESKLSLKALAKEQRALMTSKLRAYIKERDNYTCCQCSNSVYAEPNLLLEIDHIIPISKGGLTQKDNLQTLCWKCNRSKGAKINAGFS